MSNTEQRKETSVVRKKIKDLIDVAGYDQKHDCYICKDNTIIDFLQIVSKDLVNAADDDVNFDCLKFAKIYKLYEMDLKIISINFPVDTTKQQEYLNYKISKTKNEVYKAVLTRRLKEVEWIGKNNTAREYYYMIFADNYEELEKCRSIMNSALKTGKDGLVSYIEREKKEQILFRMNNKSFLVN